MPARRPHATRPDRRALERALRLRVMRDFGANAPTVLAQLEDLRFPGGELQEPLRLKAAVVLVAAGDLGRLERAIALGRTDWRDLLMQAGLGSVVTLEQLAPYIRVRSGY